MGLERYPLLPRSEAAERLHAFSEEARVCGIIPHITSFCLVADPRSVLSEEELGVIDTGIDDQRIRATFDLMEDPLRFSLREGYTIDYSDVDMAAYTRGQVPWMKRARYLLGTQLQRDPEEVELAEHYCRTGGSLFYHVRYMLLHPEIAHRKIEFLHVPAGEDLSKSLYSLDKPLAA